MEAEILHMYSQQDLLTLCVCLAVLLVVTLTVPVVLFPVCGGKDGPMEQRDVDGWVEGIGMDVWIEGGDGSRWMDGGGRDRQADREGRVVRWKEEAKLDGQIEERHRWQDRESGGQR